MKQAWKEYLILLAAWHKEMAIYLHDLTKWYVKHGEASTQDDTPPPPEPPKPPKGGDTPPPPDTP